MTPVHARELRAAAPSDLKATELVAKNGAFYNAFWSKTYLTRPQHFNTWPLIASLLPGSPQRLEIGPGLRPRLPIAGTHFLDISPPVIARLNAKGGFAQAGEITELPFADESFDLVTAFDVVEHVENDRRVFAELTRVLKPGGRLIFSVPLHPTHWTPFDDLVGHARRYEPAALQELIATHGLVVEKSVVFGMQSNSPRLLNFAVHGLTRHHSAAVRWHNWLFFPIGMLLQKPLKFSDGLIDLAGVHEVLLVCRRASAVREAAPATDFSGVMNAAALEAQRVLNPLQSASWGRIALLGCVLGGTLSAAEPIPLPALDSDAVSLETGLLWEIGSGTPIPYRLVPTLLSWRSGEFFGRNLPDGSRIVLRHRLTLIGTWIEHGPESRYIGVAGSPSLEWWNQSGTTSLYTGSGGGAGLIDSQHVKGAQGQDLTFNWFIRGGLEHITANGTHLTAGIMYQHMSNGGQTTPNPGIDALGFTLGCGRKF